MIFFRMFQWQEVFGVDTGLWNFSLTSPSKQTVSDDPFGVKLKDDIRKRTNSDNPQFYPNLIKESCPFGVHSYFNCVFKYLLVASYSSKNFTYEKLYFRNAFQMLYTVFHNYGKPNRIRHLFQFHDHLLICEYDPQNVPIQLEL